MLNTEFQASEPSGSEIEDFWGFFYHIFLCFSMVQTQDALVRAIFDPGTLFLKHGKGLLSYYDF